MAFAETQACIITVEYLFYNHIIFLTSEPILDLIIIYKDLADMPLNYFRAKHVENDPAQPVIQMACLSIHFLSPIPNYEGMWVRG